MNYADLFIIRSIFFSGIIISFLNGVYAAYYSVQGIRGKYEFKTDRKIFMFLCIISAVVDTTSLLMYYKLIVLPTQFSFLPFNLYRLLQHVGLCILYSFWLSPMERKYAYYNAIAIIPLWIILKVTGIENFSQPEQLTAPISCFLLCLQSIHFLGNLNNRTTTDVKKDALFKIGLVNIAYFGMMTVTFMLINYDVNFRYFTPIPSILQDVYYMQAIYLFTKYTNFELHDWL